MADQLIQKIMKVEFEKMWQKFEEKMEEMDGTMNERLSAFIRPLQDEIWNIKNEALKKSDLSNFLRQIDARLAAKPTKNGPKAAPRPSAACTSTVAPSGDISIPEEKRPPEKPAGHGKAPAQNAQVLREPSMERFEEIPESPPGPSRMFPAVSRPDEAMRRDKRPEVPPPRTSSAPAVAAAAPLPTRPPLYQGRMTPIIIPVDFVGDAGGLCFQPATQQSRSPARKTPSKRPVAAAATTYEIARGGGTRTKVAAPKPLAPSTAVLPPPPQSSTVAAITAGVRRRTVDEQHVKDYLQRRNSSGGELQQHDRWGRGSTPDTGVAKMIEVIPFPPKDQFRNPRRSMSRGPSPGPYRDPRSRSRTPVSRATTPERGRNRSPTGSPAPQQRGSTPTSQRTPVPGRWTPGMETRSMARRRSMTPAWDGRGQSPASRESSAVPPVKLKNTRRNPRFTAAPSPAMDHPANPGRGQDPPSSTSTTPVASAVNQPAGNASFLASTSEAVQPAVATQPPARSGLLAKLKLGSGPRLFHATPTANERKRPLRSKEGERQVKKERQQ